MTILPLFPYHHIVLYVYDFIF